MKVLVCGGRNYHNQKVVNTILTTLKIQKGITEIIEGGANGADTCARNFANKAGIKLTTVYADWKHLGKAAGWHRNYAMAEMKPDLVVAFPGGAGTAMMIRIAKDKGIPVKEIK